MTWGALLLPGGLQIIDQLVGEGLPFSGTVLGEVFEGFVVGQPPQHGFSVGGVGDVFNNLFSELFQLGEKLTMLLGENCLKLFSCVAGISRALAFGADSDLQVSTLDHGRHEKVAKLRHIDDVAKDLQLLAIFIYLLVELVVVRCRYGQQRPGKIVLGIFGLYKLGVRAPAQGRHHVVDVFGDNNHPGSGVQQSLDLSHGHSTAADHNRTARAQFQKYRIFRHSRIIPHTSRLQQKLKKNEKWKLQEYKMTENYLII